PSPFRSVQLMVAVFDVSGLKPDAIAVVCAALYRLIEYFSAVFPLPNRSYTTWNLGAMSFQFGRLRLSGAVRAGTNLPAAAVCSTTCDFRYSQRRPALMVRRFIVHVSCP